jgi:hypothetical protein
MTRFRFFVFVVLVYRDFLLFIFDLLVKGSSLHLVSVGYCRFIYKTGTKTCFEKQSFGGYVVCAETIDPLDLASDPRL